MERPAAMELAVELEALNREPARARSGSAAPMLSSVPNGPGELVEDEEYQRDDGELGYAVGIDVRRRRCRGVPCTPRPLEWRWLPVPPCSSLALLHREEASVIGLLC